MATYIEPFPASKRGDAFGTMAAYRKHPHRGQDWHPAAGTDIPAITAGTVMKVYTSVGLGHSLVQSTLDGYFVEYNHLEELPMLKQGDKLEIGQIIGHVGNTGTLTTGPHLHLAMATVKNVAECIIDKLIDPLKHIQAHPYIKPAPAKKPTRSKK